MENVKHLKVARRVAERIWAVNKYEIMAKGYDQYKEISNSFRLLDSFTKIEAVYFQINEILNLPYKKGAVITTLEHIWGYFKKKATSEEKEAFFQALEKCKLLDCVSFDNFPPEVIQCRNVLGRLLDQYPDSYLQVSRFLHPERSWDEITVRNRRFVWKNGIVFIDEAE
ncbi:MAG: YbgA family protein [Bacillaceae bacterium]|nr:YbgA family protein [Bacillaceae bacterium]